MIRYAFAAALALAGLALVPGPARADPPYGWHEHGWRGRGGCCGYHYVYPPPIYVAPPRVVYAPPPVIYAAPPPVVYVPPPVVSFGVTVPIR
jgi:hypothetical protein